MNSFIALCLLAVVGVCHSNPAPYGGYGLGYGAIYAPAISTANVIKAAPVPIIKTAAVAPIIAPAISTVPVLRTVGVSGLGLGYGGLGYGYGGYGYGLGKGLGYGLGGLGYGLGGLGYGYGGKIIG